MSFIEETTHASDGTTLYYRDYAAACGGDKAGITVLCLPGLTRSSRDFGDLAAALSANHRVLCPDLRGRGESGYAADPMSYVPLQYVKDLKIVLAAANVKRVAIVGTSLGGILAMTMAGIMREKIAGAVLNDVGPQIDPKGIERIQGYVGKGGPVESWQEAVQATKAINGPAFPNHTPEQWETMARELFAERDGQIAPNYDANISKPFAAGAAAPAASMWPFYQALIDLPTLIIRGETSDILSAKTVDEMLKQYPGAEYLEVPGVGHAPTLREPGVTQRIERFLSAIPAKEGVIGWVKARLRSIKEMGRITKALKG
jgi:pimeloyl-ACP methyl ester carboxylesterase